jgi:HAMP domain-containing protein
MADAGLVTLTGAETFWYVLMCIAFGAGYFANLPTAKALSELQSFR